MEGRHQPACPRLNFLDGQIPFCTTASGIVLERQAQLVQPIPKCRNADLEAQLFEPVTHFGECQGRLFFDPLFKQIVVSLEPGAAVAAEGQAGAPSGFFVAIPDLINPDATDVEPFAMSIGRSPRMQAANTRSPRS